MKTRHGFLAAITLFGLLATGCAFRADISRRGAAGPGDGPGAGRPGETVVGDPGASTDPTVAVTEGTGREPTVVFLPGEPEIPRQTQEAALRGEGMPIAGGLRDTAVRDPETPAEVRIFRMIHFDYDSYTIREDAQAVLTDIAAYLLQHRQVRIVVEGHCDERGTEEYNMALGERRALAARQYLVSLGVSPDRIATISYGKERPLMTGPGEEAWALNRRCEFKILERRAEG